MISLTVDDQHANDIFHRYPPNFTLLLDYGRDAAGDEDNKVFRGSTTNPLFIQLGTKTDVKEEKVLIGICRYG
ncbi:MAG: hypothetical protein EOP45_21310 [Sphingobacteriaceae bacterium]|nr:MAG: hypothetical protein EOP45_21310 [Sphingobacteriaceae bacterium]